MIFRKSIIIGLFFFIAGATFAQDSFENSLLYNRSSKFDSLYIDLMRNASSIKVINEEGFHSVVASPRQNLKGETTFVYEVADNDSLINVYMTEFWCYSTVNNEITVKDYIIFVDEDDLGFDQEKVQQYKLSPTSTEPIQYLFDYVKKNRKFKVIKPRERNLKYQRVRFE